MIKLKPSVLAQKWDAFRFRLSCVLYRNPITITASCLAVGVAVGLGVLTLNPRPAQDNPTLYALSDKEPVSVQLDPLQEQYEEKLKELSVHLSTLDARANRLDELGQQWVERMGLESESFDFSAPPAQGDGEASSDTKLDPDMLVEDVAVLAARYTRLEAQLGVLDNLAKIGEKFPEEVPHASPSYGHMTSPFGSRHDPFGRGKRFHAGIDLAAKHGDPVMAMAGGKVVFSGVKGGYGKMVEVDHGNGYRTRYAHNSALLAKVGQEVEVGQILAKAGSTGRSTGTHLHVEVWKNGQAVNPRPFLERGRQLLAERQKALAVLEELPDIEELKAQVTESLPSGDTNTGVIIARAVPPATPKKR